MKATLSIGLCTIVVLLQLMQTPMAQVCSAPFCKGAYLNTKSCQCGSVTPSTCAAGFKKVESPHGLCSCESVTTPECKKGFTLNPKSCQCTINVEPMCPYGSSLNNALTRCTGSDEPICPRGAVFYQCKCVREFVRKCEEGDLSWDGCECFTPTSTTPSCSDGCELDSSDCTCDKNKEIRCYYAKNCDGPYSVVYSVAECCAPDITVIRSYRIGNGPCTQCNIK